MFGRIPRLDDLDLESLRAGYSTETGQIASFDEVQLWQTNTAYPGQDQMYSRQILHHPGGSAVVPLHGTDVVCVVQYRPALERMTVEIPAGRRHPDEAYVDTAIRELQEETGLGAGALELLFRINAAPCCSDWEASIFLATQLYQIGSSPGPDLPTYSCLVALNDIGKLISRGLVTDGKTIASLLAVRHMLD